MGTFNTENEFKKWDEMKINYNFSNKFYLKCRQNVNLIPKTWKKILKENENDSSNLVLLDHQLLKNNCTLGIEKIRSKEISFKIISSKVNVPTLRIYFEKIVFSL